MFVILMGVAGSGKTTVGRFLACAVGWPFYDADDYHFKENKHKMASGNPLSDEDRHPWLVELRDLIAEHDEHEESGVLACSALRRAYRAILSRGSDQLAFVYLQADAELIRSRISDRSSHYMPVQLLESQFEGLEEPEDAFTLPAGMPADQLVEAIRDFFQI